MRFKGRNFESKMTQRREVADGGVVREHDPEPVKASQRLKRRDRPVIAKVDQKNIGHDSLLLTLLMRVGRFQKSANSRLLLTQLSNR